MSSVQTGAGPQPHPEFHPGLPCSLLRMAVGELVMAVPIDDVREILQVARLTPLPRTPDFIRGVMNLRGAVVPVIDLAVRLGLRRTEVGRRSCIVVVDAPIDTSDESGSHQGRPSTLGLMVDAVYEVFDRTANEIEAAPALGTPIAPGFLRGMTRAGGELIGVLALPQVLASTELSRAIAGHQPH